MQSEIIFVYKDGERKKDSERFFVTVTHLYTVPMQKYKWTIGMEMEMGRK